MAMTREEIEMSNKIIREHGERIKVLEKKFKILNDIRKEAKRIQKLFQKDDEGLRFNTEALEFIDYVAELEIGKIE